MVYIILESVDYIGALAEILEVFKAHGINLKQLSSRQSRIDPHVRCYY